MTIEIVVRDPANVPPSELRRLVAFLTAYLPRAELERPSSEFDAIRPDGTVQTTGAATLNPDDNPAAGETVVSPEEAFGAGAVFAATFAPGAPANAGNGQAAGGASSQSPAALNGATSAATTDAGNAPPAPTAGAPVGSTPAPPPAPGASASGVDLDADGLPWDARIHAGGKAKNADGRWRARRGLNDGALVARVQAELRALMAAPGPVAGGVPPAPAGNVPPVPPASLVPSPGSPALIPAAPTGAAAGGQPQAAIAGTPDTAGYIALVTAVTGAVTAGKLSEAEVAASCLEFGVPALALLATRLDLVPSVAAKISAILATRP